MKRELLGHQWKELKEKKLAETAEAEAKKDINLIECTYYDYDLATYHYQVIDETEKTELVAREYKTNPFVVLRWNKMAGEPYGRGVGLTALNDIKTLNLIKYYSLRNLAFNTPPLLVQEDAMLDVDGLELTPWSLNVVPNTETSIVPLKIDTDHDIESFKIEELTMDIKRNTYGSTLPVTGTREMTATEVRDRRMELRKNLNSVFGRLLSEFQFPLVRRIFDILKDTKVVAESFDVTKINGFIYKIDIVTPLGRIVKQAEAQAIMGIAATLVNFDPTGKLLASATDLPGLITRYLELEGLPAKFIKKPEEIEASEAANAEEDQQAIENAEQADVATDEQKQLNKAKANILEKEAVHV